MRRSVLVALVASVAVVAACSGDTEPADPPIPTDALTTDTTSPPDSGTNTDAVTQTATSSTTEPATESPSESATESPTSEAGGLPTMPEEAKEHTEAGAEAFVRHYIAAFNAVGLAPDSAPLEELSSNDCQTCANFADSIDWLADNNYRANGPSLAFRSAQAVGLGETVRVSATVDQLGGEIIDSSGDVIESTDAQGELIMVFTLSRVNDNSWRVDEIAVEE